MSKLTLSLVLALAATLTSSSTFAAKVYPKSKPAAFPFVAASELMLFTNVNILMDDISKPKGLTCVVPDGTVFKRYSRDMGWHAVSIQIDGKTEHGVIGGGDSIKPLADQAEAKRVYSSEENLDGVECFDIFEEAVKRLTQRRPSK